MAVRKRDIAKFVLLPGFRPRLWGLFGSGFGYLAFFMAQIFCATGLLPKTHPYLNGANMGRFGVSHVISEARRHLIFDRNHIDKVFIFGAIVSGLVLLLAQLVMIAISGTMIPLASAGYIPPMPTNLAGIFDTTNPTDDIAFILLERVFGVTTDAAGTGFFGTCVSTGAACFSNDFFNLFAEGAFPWPFHRALQTTFMIYSVGLLVVAGILIAYYIIAVFLETAQTGTPFGKRYNRLWAPIRLVVALALIIPLTSNLNPAQYLTLYAAKWGSGFATNAWILFNQAVVNGGPTSTLLAANTAELVPGIQSPPANSIMEFFTILATCRATYFRHKGIDIRPYLVRGNQAYGAGSSFIDISGGGVTLAQAWQFYNFGDIVIRYGHTGTDPNSAGDPLYKDETGYVAPYCGEITYKATNIVGDGTGGSGTFYGGVQEIQRTYWAALNTLWTEASSCGNAIGARFGVPPYNSLCKIGYAMAENGDGKPTPGLPPTPPPSAGDLAARQANFFNTQIYPALAVGGPVWTAMVNDPAWTNSLPPAQNWPTRYGWAGAGLWYNTLARLNGAYISEAANFPTIKTYPQVMENIKAERLEQDESVSAEEMYKPEQSDSTTPKVFGGDRDIAYALYTAKDAWSEFYPDPSKDPVRDTINALFGTDGLYDILYNNTNNIHPLAQLVAIGRGLLENSYRYFAISGLTLGVGSFMAIVKGNEGMGAGLLQASGIAMKFAVIGLAVGVVLFYLVPFLPFIYFFFAVGGWIKAIFEAMVGVPLWALAHIRLDGDGLPGDAAKNGYYLLLEIFLRPILIVFGFVAALSILSAQVKVLHEIWQLVVSNLTGYDETLGATAPPIGQLQYLRGEVDTFFYTVMYAVVVYLMAMGSFKLIDMIPNHILRWMGANVSTFGEQDGDPADNLARNTVFGTNKAAGVLQQAQGGLSGASQQLGSALHPKGG